MPRPYDPKNSRHLTISICVTEEEHRVRLEAAQRAGLTISEWGRRMTDPDRPAGQHQTDASMVTLWLH